MRITFDCPACLVRGRSEADALRCESCGWTRSVRDSELHDGTPVRCLLCGCEDLWRQKDFPQGLGLLMVGLGIVLSTIAWAYREPILALGILMGFALVDMILYAVMRDVLVCYRCHARYQGANIADEHPRFNLELNERYRQEAIRLREAEPKG